MRRTEITDPIRAIAFTDEPLGDGYRIVTVVDLPPEDDQFRWYAHYSQQSGTEPEAELIRRGCQEILAWKAA